MFDLNVALGMDDEEEYSNPPDERYLIDSDDQADSADIIDKIIDPDVSQDVANVDYVRSMKLLADEIEEKLEVGCTVVGVEPCYLLYLEYARLNGFSVRRGDQRYIAGSNDLRWKEFTCSCNGIKDGKSSRSRVGDIRNMHTRTNCDAKLIICLEDDIWKVCSFLKCHNHALLDIDQSYLLRSSRKLSWAKAGLLEALHSSGITLNKACLFVEKMYGGVQHTGYTRKDAYNHFDKRRRVTRLEDGDSMALVEYLNKKSKTDPFFFWKFETDDDGRLMNFFFRDSRSASDYKAFGDVITLDTTGGTNRYKLACAPFVGFNHHKTSVMFGIGFLSDERTSSFKWLLDAFLESMDGVAPKVVITDQCKALMNAVDCKFPNTTHRLCQWHLNRNAVGHFPRQAGYSGFKHKWHRCMDGVESEEEFEEVWNDMMTSYNIRSREWFNTTYGLRHRWASVFSKDVFTAGYGSTSRSENANKVLKEPARCTMSLHEFVCSYDETQNRWRRLERVEDTHNLWLPGQFVENNKFLIHAATVYTRKIFQIFQKECTLLHNVHIDFDKSVSLGDGRIQYNADDRIVIFNPSSNCATCSCSKWETQGLLCCHILKIYLLKNVDAIPEQYILKRWTKNAKVGVPEPICGPPPPVSDLLGSVQFVHDMTRKFHRIACTDSEEARKDIAETMEALSVRVLKVAGGQINVSPSNRTKRKENPDVASKDPKTKTPPTKKGKAKPDVQFRDPKTPTRKTKLNASNGRPKNKVSGPSVPKPRRRLDLNEY